MSQNMFGQVVEPENAPDEEVADTSSRKKFFLVGAAGLTATALVAAGAFLLLPGDDEAADGAVAAPVPVAGAPAAEALEPSAPLPTLATFNGRNPFKAKIVEGAAGGVVTDAGTAPPVDSTAVQVVGSGPSGAGPSGEAATVVSGPQGPAGQAGANGKDGKDGQDGRTPEYLTLTFRGLDAATADVADDYAFEISSTQGGGPFSTIVGGALGAEAPGEWLKLLEVKDVGGVPVARVQLGDAKPYLLFLDSPVTLL